MIYEAYLSGLIFLVTQHVIGLLAPGPCTALVIRNSIYSRLQGIWTVVGATLGSFSIKTLSVLGLALLLMHSPMLFQAFKVGGGLFLIYLGVRSLWSAYKEFYRAPAMVQGAETSKVKGAPFISGYLMSMANPMSSVRFVALFSTAITLEMPLLLQLSYLLVLAVISFTFYLCMALFFSTSTIQETMTRYRYLLNIVLGGSLIYWGIKVLQISMS
jgi:threonine/homoserine/homoserine lactone efflux protein